MLSQKVPVDGSTSIKLGCWAFMMCAPTVGARSNFGGTNPPGPSLRTTVVFTQSASFPLHDQAVSNKSLYEQTEEFHCTSDSLTYLYLCWLDTRKFDSSSSW